MSLYSNTLFGTHTDHVDFRIRNPWYTIVHRQQPILVRLHTKTNLLRTNHIAGVKYMSAIQYLLQISSVIRSTALQNSFERHINPNDITPEKSISDKEFGYMQERESFLAELTNYMQKHKLFAEIL